MSFQNLIITQENHVATVCLNRPKVRNAFNEILITELSDAFSGLAQDSTVHQIVLFAQGSVFCAGADLAWMQRMANYSETENFSDSMRLAQMLQAVHRCPQPVIALVQGNCFGGGVGLVAACDIVIATQSAQFIFSEVKLGLIPATIAPYVIEAIGARAAKRYFISAEFFDASTAQTLGLVHEVVASEDLQTRCANLITQLNQNAPQAMCAAKHLALDFARCPLDDAAIHESAKRIAQQRASQEGKKGVQAFLGKYTPSWQTK